MKSLKDRLNPNQLAKRQERTIARAVSKERLMAQATEQDQFVWQAFQSFVQSGLWTRLRWMILGAGYVNRKGTTILASGAAAIVVILVVIHYFALTAIETNMVTHVR